MSTISFPFLYLLYIFLFRFVEFWDLFQCENFCFVVSRLSELFHGLIELGFNVCSSSYFIFNVEFKALCLRDRDSDHASFCPFPPFDNIFQLIYSRSTGQVMVGVSGHQSRFDPLLCSNKHLRSVLSSGWFWYKGTRVFHQLSWRKVPVISASFLKGCLICENGSLVVPVIFRPIVMLLALKGST